MVRAYLRPWLSRAAHTALTSVGYESKAKSVAAILAWAAAVLILYRMDWQRVPLIGTDDPQASSEVRLALCVLGGLLLVFALNFVWQLIRQPALMDAELRAQMETAHAQAKRREEALEAKLAKMKDAFDAISDTEALLQRLSDLYRDGRALYGQEADIATWDQRMSDWNNEVEGLIKANFSVSDLHRYKSTRHGGEYGTPWKWPDADGRGLKQRYTSRLMSLDDLIRSGVHISGAVLRAKISVAGE